MKKYLLIVFVLSSLSAPITVWAQDAGAGQEDFIYNDHGKRDPFLPLVNAKGMIITFEKDLLITDMVLEGIMLGEGGNNIAIINGAILQVNESIGMYVVKTIKNDTVVLQKGQERFTLKLKKEE